VEEHPIQGLMRTALESLQEMTDVNTIIGEPIETPDGHVILTVSKVGFGFAAGGSEFKGKSSSGGEEDEQSESGGGSSSLPFGGGSGGGISITPIAFLIVGPKGIKTIHLDNSTHIYEKLLELAPQAIDKIQQMFQSKGGQQGSDSQSSSKGGLSKRKNGGGTPPEDVYN
jgi:sporulation protein YtfJ